MPVVVTVPDGVRITIAPLVTVPAMLTITREFTTTNDSTGTPPMVMSSIEVRGDVPKFRPSIVIIVTLSPSSGVNPVMTGASAARIGTWSDADVAPRGVCSVMIACVESIVTGTTPCGTRKTKVVLEV